MIYKFCFISSSKTLFLRRLRWMIQSFIIYRIIIIICLSFYYSKKVLIEQSNKINLQSKTLIGCSNFFFVYFHLQLTFFRNIEQVALSLLGCVLIKSIGKYLCTFYFIKQKHFIAFIPPRLI